jgi:hypothetical protein
MKINCKVCEEKVGNGYLLHPECYNKLIKELNDMLNLTTFFIKNKRTRIGMKTIETKLHKLVKKYAKD